MKQGYVYCPEKIKVHFLRSLDADVAIMPETKIVLFVPLGQLGFVSWLSFGRHSVHCFQSRYHANGKLLLFFFFFFFFAVQKFTPLWVRSGRYCVPKLKVMWSLLFHTEWEQDQKVTVESSHRLQLLQNTYVCSNVCNSIQHFLLVTRQAKGKVHLQSLCRLSSALQGNY